MAASTLARLADKAEKQQKQIKRVREQKKSDLLAQKLTIGGLSAGGALLAGVANGLAWRTHKAPTVQPALRIPVPGTQVAVPVDAVAGVVGIGVGLWLEGQASDVFLGLGLGPTNVALGRAGFALVNLK